MIQLENKTCLISSIKKYMKETGKITALTIGFIVPVSSFAQVCNDSDPTCIEHLGPVGTIGDPPSNPPIGPPDPVNPPGCDFIGDPDCDDG
ncbi:MAG: hypothetical protein L3J52_01850, partial [Proteobacteria bacterium]|nr:hypothetical protein [Pseudomonadota bacterium]